MSSHPDPALIIFIKNPILSKVKTRLATAIGEENALMVYHQLLEITKNRALHFHGKRYLFYSDFVDEQDAWNPAYFIKKLQEGDTLGDRMSNAFQTLFSEHRPIVIIGSDCPYIQNEIWDQILIYLKSTDCVIGPAKDGGYYLLGLNKMIPGLFTNKSWSTSGLLKETQSTLESNKNSYVLLDVLEDIDTVEDWHSFLKYREAGST